MSNSVELKEAFEYYYALGTNRSLKKVAERFNKGFRTVLGWSAKHNWTLKVEQREIEVNKKIEQKSIQAVVDEKANFRKDIRAAMGPVRDQIGKIIKAISEEKLDPIKVKSVKEYRELIEVYRQLLNMDLLLVGESTDKTTHEFESPKTFTEWLIKEEDGAPKE